MPDKEMVNGMRVLVLLGGDSEWRSGVVIDAGREWVEIDATDPIAPFIADNSSIVEWREAD